MAFVSQFDPNRCHKCVLQQALDTRFHAWEHDVMSLLLNGEWGWFYDDGMVPSVSLPGNKLN